MTTPLVWLPFDPELLGDPPDSLRYEVVAGTDDLPDSIGDVAFYVPPSDADDKTIRPLGATTVLMGVTRDDAAAPAEG